MNEELKIIIKAVTDGAKKGVNDVKKELEGLSGAAKGVGSKVGAAMKAIGTAAAAVVATIVAVTTALVALGKSTLQYNREQAKLVTAFQAAGSSAKQAGETYKQLYRYLGDSGKAVEAANHLAKITTNEQNLAQWTKITQGIYASFGDSLPIEGLTESANETIRVGKVTGNLADALNWAGVSEDEFNAKLATTNSLEEREEILRSTLNGLYEDAANIYEKNNKALLDYNQSQAELDAKMGAAGAATMPLLTALNNLGSAFFSMLKPAIDAIIPPLVTFINWITKAVESVLSFFSAITGKSATIKAVGQIADATSSAAQSASNLGANMGGAEKAAGGAAKAAEAAKKATQGFDELNIVSSGKSAGGGSGGGGGGSSAPGYASGGGGATGNFATEVQETGGMATGLMDSIKNAFSGLADVFAPSIEAWSGAMATIKEAWNNAKPDFINGLSEIQQGFTTLVIYLGSEFIPQVVNSFSTNLAPVVGDVFGFMIEEAGKQFSWLGGYVNTTVNDIIIPYLDTWKTVATDTFEIIGGAWDTHGDTLLQSFSGTLESLRGHFDNFYTNVFKPIWDKVLEVFNAVWENGLKPLVDKFVNAFLSIATELSILYNKVLAPIVNWVINNVLPPIVKVINGIIEIVGNLFTAISNFVGAIIDIFEGIIKFLVGVFTGDWSKAWDGVKKIFSGFWDAIKAIIDILLSVLGGIATFIVDVVAAAFSIAWEAIKLVWEQVVAFFQSVWDGIVSVFSSVGTWFSDIFSQAWEGIKSIWNGASTFFSGVWGGIKSAFSNVAGWFKDIFSKAWKGVLGVFSATGQVFKGIAEGILTVFKTVVNFLIDGINTVVKKPFEGLNTILNKIQNIKIVGVKPFGWLSWRAPVPQLPKLARGGIVDAATIAMIGERGKEAVVPLENNTEWMDKLADRLSARNSTPSKIVLMIDGKQLGWANINSINDITRQTGALQLQLV